MELRHLEYFVAVADERNFTRASEQLHVVQSGVSAAVKALERELGSPLFERTSKRVDLTDAGAALLPLARATLDAARDARDAVDQVRGGLRGTLRIGTMTSVGLIDVPALLGEFHRRHPDVTIRLSVNPSGSLGLVEALAVGSLDLALVSLPGPPPPGVTVRALATALLVLVVPAHHRLAGCSSVTVAELEAEQFVDFPVGYGNRAVVDRAFDSASVHRHVVLEVTDVATGADFVRHGLGIAILPRFVVSETPDLSVLTIAGADLSWPMAVATSSARSPSAAARVMLQLFEEHVSGTGVAGGRG
jgi:DNA-binding transcriptional LysR family regulator